MKETMLKGAVSLVILGVAAAWWHFGGTVVAVTLGVLTLTGLIFVAFTLGSLWTYKSIQAGANMAIQSSAVNDRYDAVKTKALADLVGEALKVSQKQKRTAIPPTALPLFEVEDQPNQPLLPAFSFPIDGLDDENNPEPINQEQGDM